MIVTFEIPINPKGAQRFRFTKAGHRYTPNDMTNYQAVVRQTASAQIQTPMTGQVGIMVKFYFQRPKSLINKPNCRKPKPQEGFRHTSKPDLDNLLKNIMDGLNGVAWLDDRQVCKAVVEKWTCSAQDNRPRVVVTVGDELG